MPAVKPIVMVHDQDHYSPWGEFYAKIYAKVSPSNPIHCEPEQPPTDPNAPVSSGFPTAVQPPILFPDPSEANKVPQTYYDQFRRGAELYSEKRFSQAVECFHFADRQKPGEPDCIVMLANCYQNMNLDGKAESIYKYALDLDPHHAIAWFNRGLVLQRMCRFQEARDNLLNAYRDRYLSGTPALEGVVTALAAVLTRLGDLKSASRVLAETVKLHGGKGPLVSPLVDTLADMGETGSAIDMLKFQQPEDLEEWYPAATGPYCLNFGFRQTELLQHILSTRTFTIPKYPAVRDGFRSAITAAIAKIKADGVQEFSMLELGGLGMYSMWALKQGCARAACRVKSWPTLNVALWRAFQANGFDQTRAQIQEYVPTPHGMEDPLAELPENCKLVVQGINCAPTVPLLLTRMAKYQEAGIATVPSKAALVVVGIQCDQLHQQTNVGPIVSGFDVSKFGDFCNAIKKYTLSINLAHTGHVVLTEPVVIPIKGDPGDLMNTKVEMVVKIGGRLDAIATWYDFELGEGIDLSMGPASGVLWKQNVQMVHLKHDVKSGEKLDMETVITRWSKDFAQQWVMFDKIGLVDADPSEKHSTALGSFDALGGAVWHFDMMADLKRNDAYERALRAAVKPDSIVLDIGTGSGLLAMMAARAGAKHVYACEMNADVAQKARTVIKANGLQDKVTVYGLRSTALLVGQHLPAKADVVVTETMGTDLLSESMYISLNDARQRLMTPDAVSIPSVGRVMGQLVEVTNPWQIDGFARPEPGDLDLTALNTLIPNFWTITQSNKIQYKPLSAAVPLLTVDFAVPLNPKGVLEVVRVPATSPGRLHAILLWWDALLGRDAEGDITIETGPESRYANVDHAHWSQMVHVVSVDGLPVAAGEQVPVVVYSDNHMTVAALSKAYLKAKAAQS